MLENGYLIFVRDESDMGQAIQTSTGNYSHVAIYLDGMIYHASGQAGIVCQEPADFFESNHLYDLYIYPEIDINVGEGKSLQTSRKTLQCFFLSRWSWFLLFPVHGRNPPIFETIPMKFGDGEQEISDFGESIIEN